MPKWSEPGKALPRTNYEVSGTEAAEAAVHLVLTHTKRRYIISFSSSFHGMGLATKILSGINAGYGTYLEGWGGGVIKAPYPYSEHLPAGLSEEQYTEYCLWYLDDHIPSCIAARDNIAGILVEPGLAEGGNFRIRLNLRRNARRVSGKMLENGAWALSDREDTIRLYPALNMDESVLREGLEIMEDAVRHVEEHGHTEGDAGAYPSGVAGF